jgi:hypothetical protein
MNKHQGEKFLLCFIFVLGTVALRCQTLVYKDVAGVFYARCTNCHHTGAHDYPFMNYTETAAMQGPIQNALNTGKMPPWSADTTYTRFQHERIITAPEKQKILSWIATGAQKGDTTLAPPAPMFSSHFQLAGEADLTLGIGSFTSTSSSSDKYYCFSIPSGLVNDRIIRAFEVVPGDKHMVHHAVITADTTGSYPSDLSGSCYNIPGNLGIGTYAPGARATVFPSKAPLKAGIYLKAGSKVIIQLHYPAGSAGEVDSTKIRLYFYPEHETGVRPIYSATPLQNWNMFIPANSVVAHSAWYPSPNTNIPVDVSVFGVMPHSHLLCESIINYAVKPGIDTIPLVRVPHWDFEWQDYFIFKRLVKVPAGYRLYANHVFDNTTNNPHNPNNPPLHVYAGTDTDDEMLFDGILFLPYQSGDELIDIEAIINSDPLLAVPKHDHEATRPSVYPSPFHASATFAYSLTENSDVTVAIYDVSGQQVFKHNAFQRAGEHAWKWNGNSSSGELLPPGVYFYTYNTNKGKWSGKIIKGTEN